jgi:hypothetical protein
MTVNAIIPGVVLKNAIVLFAALPWSRRALGRDAIGVCAARAASRATASCSDVLAVAVCAVCAGMASPATTGSGTNAAARTSSPTRPPGPRQRHFVIVTGMLLSP